MGGSRVRQLAARAPLPSELTPEAVCSEDGGANFATPHSSQDMTLERFRASCPAIDQLINRLIELELPLPDEATREGPFICGAVEPDRAHVFVRTRRTRLSIGRWLCGLRAVSSSRRNAGDHWGIKRKLPLRGEGVDNSLRWPTSTIRGTT
jgi:hypothetical protein